MNIHNILQDLSIKYDIHTPRAWTDREGDLCFTLFGIPVLPYFVDLAHEFNVPLAAIKVCTGHIRIGCSTCGHGGGVDIEIIVKLGDKE